MLEALDSTLSTTHKQQTHKNSCVWRISARFPGRQEHCYLQVSKSKTTENVFRHNPAVWKSKSKVCLIQVSPSVPWRVGAELPSLSSLAVFTWLSSLCAPLSSPVFCDDALVLFMARPQLA